MVPLMRCVKFMTKIFVVFLVMFVISNYRTSFLGRRKFKSFQIWRMPLQNENLKYILIWSQDEPDLDVLKEGQKVFIENDCVYRNCFVTKKRNFSSTAFNNFDAIIISGRNISDDLPVKRYADQVFIFSSKESADNYPACNAKYENYFNWTWTYKLNSDIVWTYFRVLDNKGKEVAPSENPKWRTGLKKFSKKLGKGILGTKKFAVAWFASNCYTRSKRETFVLRLQHALKFYGLDVHVVGSCGTRTCPIRNDKECVKVLGRYYFYLAFENSLAEDYVTEKVLKALYHYTVPVVFGGANYTRFLPPGSYINARELGHRKTAALMASLIANNTAYLEYFNWHNHYTFNDTDKSICTLCKWLNRSGKEWKPREEFRKWWNPENETCRRRQKRSTIRSRILGMVLGSTCSLFDEVPNLVSTFKNIYKF